MLFVISFRLFLNSVNKRFCNGITSRSMSKISKTITFSGNSQIFKLFFNS